MIFKVVCFSLFELYVFYYVGEFWDMFSLDSGGYMILRVIMIIFVLCRIFVFYLSLKFIWYKVFLILMEIGLGKCEKVMILKINIYIKIF